MTWRRDKKWISWNTSESLMNWNIIDKQPVKKQLTVISFITMARSKQKMRIRKISNGLPKGLTNTTTSHSCLGSSSRSIGLPLERNWKMTSKAILTTLKVVKWGTTRLHRQASMMLLVLRASLRLDHHLTIHKIEQEPWKNCSTVTTSSQLKISEYSKILIRLRMLPTKKLLTVSRANWEKRASWLVTTCLIISGELTLTSTKRRERWMRSRISKNYLKTRSKNKCDSM